MSVGGNVCATGPKPSDGSAWVIGVQDPDGTASEYLLRVNISEGSLVSSGDYQRYYTVDGRALLPHHRPRDADSAHALAGSERHLLRFRRRRRALHGALLHGPRVRHGAARGVPRRGGTLDRPRRRAHNERGFRGVSIRRIERANRLSPFPL